MFLCYVLCHSVSDVLCSSLYMMLLMCVTYLWPSYIVIEENQSENF